MEELESRLSPASYRVSAQLEVSRLDTLNPVHNVSHAVVFFESAVADYQILQQGLDAGTDAVVLDSSGDGLKEMAAFLTSRHDLTTIGIVAHGAPGMVALGRANLDQETLQNYLRELSVLGSALVRGGELDLWSCQAAAGQSGVSLVQTLAAVTGTGVAAADHLIGSPRLGGNWQLDVRIAGAQGEVPFAPAAFGTFHDLLGTWSSAGSLSTARNSATATLLNSGKVLVAGGQDSQGNALSSAELYDPSTNSWSSAANMATARSNYTATLLRSGKVLVVGGAGVTGRLSSAELYDPTTNSWSPAGSPDRYGTESG
jgi:hypothetical protein